MPVLDGSVSTKHKLIVYATKTQPATTAEGFAWDVFDRAFPLAWAFLQFLQLEHGNPQMTDLVTYPQGKLKLFVAIQ